MIAFGYPPRQAQGLLGTWVKIPSLETVEMPGHAGCVFVVADLEHAPLGMETAYRLIAAAQAAGMAALVRLSDGSGAQMPRLREAGADGLLVPRISDLETAERITRAMVSAPGGTRGLGPPRAPASGACQPWPLTSPAVAAACGWSSSKAGRHCSR